MLHMASRDTQGRATDDGLASRRCAHSAITGGVNEQQVLLTAHLHDRYDPPTGVRRRDHSGLRKVGAAIFSVVVRISGRVGRQRGFHAA